MSPLSPIRLILTAALASLILLVAFSPVAAEVMDLAKWEKAGLPDSVRERMVIQSLSQRARPPLSGDFLLAMTRYGGESLALKYMSLDSATALRQSSPLSPEVVNRLMKSGVPRADLEAIIDSAANSAPSETQPVAPPVALRPVSEVTVHDINQNINDNDQNTAPLVAPTAPRAPRANSAPVNPTAPTKAELRKIPQTLYPGQPADPARPLPAQPGPYPIRKPQGTNGVFMGVEEVVKPDGHVYEVNSNGRKDRAGFEVLSRPSGHKVYRYFSGRTDKTRPAPAPERNYDNDDYADEEY